MSSSTFSASNMSTTGKSEGSRVLYISSEFRWDRDEWVTINMKDVKENARHNFKIRPRMGESSSGLPYEYCSIMHYPSRAFSKVSPF